MLVDQDNTPLAVVLRYPVAKEHLEENDPYLVIEDAEAFLKEQEYMFWEFQAFIKGVTIKDHPHRSIAQGIVDKIFFMDAERRVITHASDFQYFHRRDLYFTAPREELLPLIHPKFKEIWFDPIDAGRTFTAMIYNLVKIHPVPVESLWVYRSHGTVNKKDKLIHPRVVIIPEQLAQQLGLGKKQEQKPK